MKIYKYTVHDMSEDEKRKFVQKCEDEFEIQLENAAKKIVEEGSKIITLSGPTCSGKTTTASRFISAIESAGKRVGVVSIDDFYKARALLEIESKQRGLEKVDYDSALSIDLELFERCVDGILSGEIVKMPKYSFTKGERAEYYDFDSSKYDYMIFEGIQAVYPEVTSHIHCGYTSVQISVATDVEVNGSFFTSRQIRFLRRMIRDAKFRNAPPETTFRMWKGVSENEDLHILPFAGKYDIELDSYMEYEPFMIKNMVEKLLERIHVEDGYYNKAMEILEKMKGFFEISPNYLPEKSVYHEFLG
ncbi:MAG: hypothetical protein E7574_05135 [Ruminococcaceae bacterium]|nr:hypothetical protein [Oscillospiraceae bacterium]